MTVRLTALVATLFFVAAIVAAIHLALSGLDSIEITAAGR